VQPLGEPEAVAVDTRIIVATQESLALATKKKRFRQDLLARIDGMTVSLPPLRKRIGDVPALFARVFSDLDSDEGSSLRARDLPARMISHLAEQAVGASEPVDLPALIVALRASQGNVAQAASVLGISRQRRIDSCRDKR